MPDRHVIVGAGPVGRHVAALLAERGSDVALVSRSGTDTGVAGVEHVAADATDADGLTEVATGAAVLYNCANPRDYTKWMKEWPPLASAMLAAAELSGATYVITGNLYPYGPLDEPMTESHPDVATDKKARLRADMWADALAAHRAGRVRVVEVRGADYVGPGVGENGHVTRHLAALKAGKRAWVIGSADQPHSWTDVGDMARALVAAAEDESAHGRIWHAPTNAPRTQRQALSDVARAGGFPEPKVSAAPGPALAIAALVVPLVREVREMSYQWTRPYVLDDTASRAHFGLQPTPWDEVCRRTAAG
ncbi:NAD-dependent epimerase/dehydratase family protein [Aeromicrobium sp.]|uniref:NAD-dependent epimerase/dehydratase family protein n=1 Tax=Aeromicrobium sp. TaxID=1871063 RepID=UPI003D6A93DE